MTKDALLKLKVAAMRQARSIAQFLFPEGEEKTSGFWHIGNIQGDRARKNGSLRIDLTTGRWKDHNPDDGEEGYDDIIGLWRKARNLDFPTTLKELKEFLEDGTVPVFGNGSSRNGQSSEHAAPKQSTAFRQWRDYHDRAHANRSELCHWRGFRRKCVDWLIANHYIGKRYTHWCIPRRSPDGVIESVQVYPPRTERDPWFEPKGAPTRPYIIGNPTEADHIFISESPWDAIAVADFIVMEEADDTAVIATFGAENWKLIPKYEINVKGTVYLVIQNDEAGRKWRDEAIAWIGYGVIVVTPPVGIKDMNDWIRHDPAPTWEDFVAHQEKVLPPEPEPKPETSGTGNENVPAARNIGDNIKYCLDGRSWWSLNTGGEWIPMATDGVRRYLKVEYNLCGKTYPTENFSEVDQAIHDLEMNHYVDIAGKYAGYLHAGIYEVASSKLLVPRSHRLPEVTEGSCETILAFIRGMFTVPQQLDAFLGWMQTAVRTLRESEPGQWTPGQALVLLGGTGVGKTALQQELITHVLTKRWADPSKYYTGETSFNADLAEAEHWIISDAKWTDHKERQKFAKSFKNDVANNTCAIHPKNRQQIHLPIFKRISISLNEDEESMSVLPAMDPSYLEKLLLLNCFTSEYAPTKDKYKAGWPNKIHAEAPAFLHYLLHQYQIPEDMCDIRYGVRYRNKPLEDKLSNVTMEDKNEVMDDLILRTVLLAKKSFEGTPAQFYELIFGKDSHFKETASTSNLPRNAVKLGKLFTQWSEENGGKRKGYVISKRKLHGYSHYALRREVEV